MFLGGSIRAALEASTRAALVAEDPPLVSCAALVASTRAALVASSVLGWGPLSESCPVSYVNSVAGIHVDPHLSVMFPVFGIWGLFIKRGSGRFDDFLPPRGPPKNH